jgi:hypothetical protein
MEQVVAGWAPFPTLSKAISTEICLRIVDRLQPDNLGVLGRQLAVISH